MDQEPDKTLNFDTIYKHNNVNTAVDTFYNILNFNKKSYNIKQKSREKWVTIGIKNSIKIRNKLFRQKKLQLAQFYKSKIKHYCNILKQNYYKNLISITDDCKTKWNLLAEYLKFNNKKCNYNGDINHMNVFCEY